MKRTKPAVSSPQPPAPPETKGSSLSESGNSPKEDPSPEPLLAEHKSEALPLGLATSGPVSSPSETEKPIEVSKPDRKLTSSVLPPILLEGDETQPTSEPIRGQKFAVPHPKDSKPAPSSQGLPISYGTGRLLLTARDPQCLYAHWDLTPEQQQEYTNRSAQKQLELRVHQDSLSGPVVSQVSIPAQTHHLFVPIDVPGAKRFVAELGYSSAEGGWRTVAAAEAFAAALPSSRSQSTVQFATLSFAGRKPIAAEVPHPERADARHTRPEISRAPSKPEFPLPSPLSRPEAMESDWPEIAPPQEPQSWNELAADAESLASMGDLVDATSHFVSQRVELGTRVDAEWSTSQERALAELIGWSVIRSTSIESAGIEELLRGIRRVGISSLGELPAAFIAGPGQAQLSSAGLSSTPPLAQEFWFNVNAELVIYGATQPGAAVSIGGRPISLRSDGTFSYRFSLPEGSYELPLVARSRRGEERSATLEFSRDTTYSEGTGSHPQAPELKAPLVENIS